MTIITPYRISVTDAVLADLKEDVATLVGGKPST